MKELQYVSLGTEDLKRETFRVTIDNVDKGGTFVLRFQNPDDLSWTNSN